MMLPPNTVTKIRAIADQAFSVKVGEKEGLGGMLENCIWLFSRDVGVIH